MKVITVFIFLFVLVLPAIGDGLNGFDWKRMEESEVAGVSLGYILKGYFVVGYIQSLLDVERRIIVLKKEALANIENKKEQIARTDALRVVQMAIPSFEDFEEDELLTALDAFYSDYKNLNTNIGDAIFMILEEYAK